MILSGTPSFTLGTNGVGRFFSGSAAVSTGLSAVVDAEFVVANSTCCSTPQGVTLVSPRLNAIYREESSDPAKVAELVGFDGTGAAPGADVYEAAGVGNVTQANLEAW